MTTFWYGIREYVSPVVATFIGGYLFTWGFASLVITGSVFFGADFHPAEYTAFLLAFPVFLAVFFLVFLSRQRTRAWLLAYASGALMIFISWWLQLQMLSQEAIK